MENKLPPTIQHDPKNHNCAQYLSNHGNAVDCTCSRQGECDCPTHPKVGKTHTFDCVFGDVHTTNEKQDWEAWARLFHDTYERLAPSFGYETREDTKQFDPQSNNGRLMIAVCAEIISKAKEEGRREQEEECKSGLHKSMEWHLGNQQARHAVIAEVEKWGWKNITDKLDWANLRAFLASLKTNSK